ncbi:MAG TPA: beta-L-arabinofuranosidase domain-containing protein [Polyangiaceae bacterium]
MPAVLPGCTCGGGKGNGPLDARTASDFGDVHLPPPPDAQPYLALARAVIEHGPEGRGGVPAPPALPGRRVGLVFYRGDGDSVVATAKAGTLADSVAAAAEAIAPKVKDASKGRIELDVVTEATSADAGGHELTDGIPITSVGLDGVLVTQDDGKTGLVLPGEVVQRRLFHQAGTVNLSRDKIEPLLASRAGVGQTAIPAMREYSFRTDAHVESPAHDRALPVLRGMVQAPASVDDVTPERLVEAVRRGADYLARVTNADGRFVYMYRPVEDRDERSYGWLRHAGTTYALLEAYEELGTPLYLEKAELALRYLTAHLHDDPASQGKYALDTMDEEQQKAGGAGISLVAFAKHAAVTGKRDDLETMRALARLITKQQYEDGHFRSNADLDDPARRAKKEVIYYVGEAILGLMRLYAIDPQQAYLDAAKRGADWVVHVRDVAVSEENQEHDHWMAYALNDLYRVTKDRAYLEHAYKIARAIHDKQRTPEDAPSPDLVATFYNGATTPGSTRLEAYDAAASVARFAGEPDAWIVGPSREVARWILGQQFDAVDDYWVRNPAKADGGVRESLYDPDVEIDYVQHAMSGWLHLARLLRDPAYGKTGTPSQDPVKPPVGPVP